MQEQQYAKPPLACTLTPDELRARRQQVRNAITSHILSVRTRALSVTITLSSSVEPTVIAEFVEFERRCCAFLTFETVEQPDSTDLVITGPTGAESTLELFADEAQKAAAGNRANTVKRRSVVSVVAGTLVLLTCEIPVLLAFLSIGGASVGYVRSPEWLQALGLIAVAAGLGGLARYALSTRRQSR